MEFEHYEVLRELFEITEWKDDSVYKTKSLGYMWIAAHVEKQNVPRESNLIYAVPPTSYEGPTIRRTKPA
jgi:hypothetical protein